MPVSIVVGGQFGSEGKGKVAYELARKYKSPITVRVGGSNSGHTIIDSHGKERKFRALPTACVHPQSISVIAVGSYIDPDIMLAEIKGVGLKNGQVLIDPNAVVITDGSKRAEADSQLKQKIGSTLSGTGAAVISRLLRDGTATFAKDVAALSPFIQETRSYLRGALDSGRRVIIEGTQGFGLSVLHANCQPYVTSRDTTAAGFLSEAGLSPLDVDEVVMVIRAFPIRVAGNSGPLPNEIDWELVTKESGYKEPIVERTTVTNNVRRVARFDSTVVRAAIEANNPTMIVLNHVDYIDSNCRTSHAMTVLADKFVSNVESMISRKINFVGFGPSSMISRADHADLARFA